MIQFIDDLGTALSLQFGRYENGHIAIIARDDTGEYATLTVNMGVGRFSNDAFFLKHWSENEGLAEKFIETFSLVPTGRSIQSGFITAKEYRLPDDWKQYIMPFGEPYGE